MLFKRALKIRENLQNLNCDHKKEIEESQRNWQRLLSIKAERTKPAAASSAFINALVSPAETSPGAPKTVRDTTNRSQNNKALLDAVHETEIEVSLLREMVGPNHPNVADLLTKLADLYCRLKMLAKMEPVLLEALRIREVSFGHQHLTVATELKNLAMLYLALERFTAAEPLLKRAISIREKNLGRNHNKVADIEQAYVALLRKTNRSQQADYLERHIFEVRGKTASESGLNSLPESMFRIS